MKSFKTSLQHYSQEEMIDWCCKNIPGFNKSDYKSYGFIINVDEQKIICKYTFFIRTLDEELPFSFHSLEGYVIESKNLKKINLQQFSLIGETLLIFDNVNKIDYNEVEWITGMHVAFHYSNVKLFNNVNPQQIHDARFDSLAFKCGVSNTAVCDFDNYNTSMVIKEFSIAPGSRFKNLTNLLNLNIIDFYMLSGATTIYTLPQIKKIESVIEKYNTGQNKAEFVMDMTLELIDAGYEDEVV